MNLLQQLSAIVNSGQTRSVILTGNIYDLFFDGKEWVPLMQYLQAKYRLAPADNSRGITQVVMEINHAVEVADEIGRKELESIWSSSRPDDGKTLEMRFKETYGDTVYAFQLLRQLTFHARSVPRRQNNLLILIEGADLLLPEAEISRLNLADRRRIGIVQDWFCDPNFTNGYDTVIFVAESINDIHHRIARLPQVVNVKVPLPDNDTRSDFILSCVARREKGLSFGDKARLIDQTAGLSLQAINQLLRSGDFSEKNIAKKVENYMISQLGEGVVEFKRPTHTLNDVVGFGRLKKFMKEQLIPGFMVNGPECMAGAAVAGPIGSGKTYICEAVASELGVPVITLKNIRSKWYGETDQIFERLRQLLESFHKIVIFVDEADTMFGDVQSDQDTERRLTGKIQAMMSDPALLGKVIWFLMTARIHRLSPDIRRPGRMDLIIPILDPEGEDLGEFIRWALKGIELGFEEEEGAGWPQVETEVRPLIAGWSAAEFAELRKRIKREKCKFFCQAVEIIKDIASPDIGDTRLYQTLQAKLNCTRRSLLVEPNEKFEQLREGWRKEADKLEQKGVR